jgi:NADPH:quinone reductase-like Zn-dependent oxidoreductase
MGRWLVGKRVACLAREDGNGPWAEYMVASTDTCIPLVKTISFEQAACLTVNPMTANALLEIARRGGHSAFVQTAAASALGSMVGRLANRLRLPGIHVVRRPEQVRKLEEMGFENVVDSSDGSFRERLAEICRRLKATIAFDAVGGELTRHLAAAMPPRSRIIVFGKLAEQPCQIDTADLMFRDQSLEGFWLSRWIKNKGFFQKLQLANRIQRFLPNELQTRIQAQFPLEDIQAAITLYEKQRTEGKVLLVPSPVPHAD